MNLLPTGEALALELGLTLSNEGFTLASLADTHLPVTSLHLAIQLPIPTDLEGDVTHGQLLVDECHFVSHNGPLRLKPGFFEINKAVYDLIMVGRYTHWFFQSEKLLYPIERASGAQLMDVLPIRLTRNNKEHLTRHVILPTPVDVLTDLTYTL